MRVTCISKSAHDLPSELIRPELGLGLDREYSLIVGKEYVVYGMTMFLGHLWFYICDEDFTHYPVWNPAPLFKLTDSRLSHYWRLGFTPGDRPGDIIPTIAFKEWVDDPFFYDRLTDGETRAVATFKRYKDLLDAESRAVMTEFEAGPDCG